MVCKRSKVTISTFHEPFCSVPLSSCMKLTNLPQESLLIAFLIFTIHSMKTSHCRAKKSNLLATVISQVEVHSKNVDGVHYSSTDETDNRSLRLLLAKTFSHQCNVLSSPWDLPDVLEIFSHQKFLYRLVRRICCGWYKWCLKFKVQGSFKARALSCFLRFLQ